MPAKSIDDRTICDEASPAAVQPLPPGVHAGGAVLLRGRRWHVDATVAHDDCQELHLTDITGGPRRIVLWPFDRPAAGGAGPRLRAVRLREWTRRVLDHAAQTIDPLTPRTSRCGADIIPFQLAPAVTMAAGTARILLADEVGLGKTIQAGWIVADVIARDPGARVMLAVPAGLRQQWAAELSTRFAIVPSVVDARWLRAAVADLPTDVSPWTPPGVYVGSLDFLKRADVAASIGQHLWALLVIDEAHTATAPTDRYAALAQFASVARKVIAITATPYSGDPPRFASLMAIGAAADEDRMLMFRRTRGDAGDPRRRRHHFARLRITRAEDRLQRLLERYSREVWNEPLQNREGARLAVTILRKRALSSPAAAARSLRRRLELLQGHVRAPRQLDLFDAEDALNDDETPAALAAPGLADAGREHRCLTALIAAADAARDADSKLRFLRRLVARLGTESAVIFTEYRDTLLDLAAALPPTLQLHGGLTTAQRALVQERFNREGGLLLATDAAAEGLNLHQRCRVVVSHELPWNPARLEQRIGRVDRIGQRRTVHALTLTARDTAEDLVVRNLARRLSRVVAALGANDRLGAFLSDARIAGIVIGGDPDAVADDTLAHEGGMVEFARDDGRLERAVVAAAQLTFHQAIAAGTARRASGADVLVSHLRSRSPGLEPGYVVAIACTARTIDGFLAARRQILLHVPDQPVRPKTAASAREIATQVLKTLDVTAPVSGVNAWFAEVQAIHNEAVGRQIARETALENRERSADALQPSLFDRRAVAAAERIATSDCHRSEERRRHIEALERSRILHLGCAPSALLIVWR